MDMNKLVKKISDFKRYAEKRYGKENNPLLDLWNGSPLKPKWKAIAVMLSDMTGVDFREDPRKLSDIIKGGRILDLTEEFISRRSAEEAVSVFEGYDLELDAEFYSKIKKEMERIASSAKSKEEESRRKTGILNKAEEKPVKTVSKEKKDATAREPKSTGRPETAPEKIEEKKETSEEAPAAVSRNDSVSGIKNRVVIDYGQLVTRYYVFDPNGKRRFLKMDARISMVDPYTSCTVVKGSFYRLWGSDDRCKSGMEGPIDVVNPEDLSIFAGMLYGQAEWLFGELGNFGFKSMPEVMFSNDYFVIADDPDGRYSAKGFFETGESEFYEGVEWVVKPRYRMAVAFNVSTGETVKLREFGLDDIAKKEEAYDYNLFIRRFLKKTGRPQYEERVKKALGAKGDAVFLY